MQWDLVIAAVLLVVVGYVVFLLFWWSLCQPPAWELEEIDEPLVDLKRTNSHRWRRGNDDLSQVL